MPLPPWVPRKKRPPGKHVGGRYTLGNAGRAPDIPDSPRFRSRMERNYARWLNFNQIRWQYEPKRFVFAGLSRGVTSFLPDFYLPDEDKYHEIKGFLDKKSATQLKRMKKYYPAVTVLVIPKQLFDDIEKKGLCRLVDGWECKHYPDRLTAETRTYQEIPNPQTTRKRRKS